LKADSFVSVDTLGVLAAGGTCDGSLVIMGSGGTELIVDDMVADDTTERNVVVTAIVTGGVRVGIVSW